MKADMDGYPNSMQAQLGVSFSEPGHRRTPSNVSSVTTSSSQDGYEMLGRPLDQQSLSAAGPYRTARSTSVCSLEPSESSQRYHSSRASSISAPYSCNRRADMSDAGPMGWSSEPGFFQQFQDIQLGAQDFSHVNAWQNQHTGPWSAGTEVSSLGEHDFPSLLPASSGLCPPTVAVSAPGQSLVPIIHASDAPTMTFAANHQLGFRDGQEEPGAEEAREEQLATLARSVRCAHTTSQGDKARSSFVQAWLTSNYVIWPEGNVSRQALYSSYSMVCEKFGVRGINSASFGKAVRAAFPQIKTRRLGVRGNSKYHYCGMRPSNMTEARLLAELTTSSDGQIDPSGHCKTSSQGSEESGESANSPGRKRSLAAPPKLNLVPPIALPVEFPTCDEAVSTASSLGLEAGMMQELWSAFTKSALHMVESFQAAKYEQFELALRGFFKESVGHAGHRSLLEAPAIAPLQLRAFATVFNCCITLLQDRALSPAGESASTLQQFSLLKQLAETVESFVSELLAPFGSIYAPITELAARFGHLINRHLGLCQVVQALLGIINSPTAVEELSESWQSMDFPGVCNHCALAVNCSREKLFWCFQTFGRLLQSPHSFSLSDVTQWTDGLMSALAAPERQAGWDMSPQMVLIRCSFVATQLMRDLTLRSDRSFGTFQLLSLFVQEWIGLSVMQQMTLSIQAVAGDMPTSFNSHDSPALSLHSEELQDSSRMGQNHQALQQTLHSQATGDSATLQASSFGEGSGTTPQYASFSSGTPFMEDQKTAMTTPMASSWRKLGQDETTALGAEGLSSYWAQNSAIPIVPTSPFISDFFPSFGLPLSADKFEGEQ